jgi:tetratricopeptide (TPR) repeat protein
MAKRKNTQEEPLIEVVSGTGSNGTADFAIKNQNLIFSIVGAILLIIAAYVMYTNLVSEPRNKEAMAQSAQAQFQFERDSFQLALSNPGQGYPGFLDIIKDFKGTKAANLAKYYAGISYLNLGDYNSALEYLQEFQAVGTLLPISKWGALGDVYAELGQMDKSRNSYEKAVAANANELLTPYYLKKLGALYEMQGNKAGANQSYTRIKSEFPTAIESNDIQKYIVRSSN